MAKRPSRFVASFAAIAVLATLGAVIGSFPAAADEAGTARGYAYGIAGESFAKGNVQPAPEAEAVVPPGTTARDVARARELCPNSSSGNPQQPSPSPTAGSGSGCYSEQDVLLEDILGLIELARVEADACIQPGVFRRLQADEDRAEYLANGGDPALDTAPPERTEVYYQPGFPGAGRCVTPVNGQTDDRSGTPSPSPAGEIPAQTSTVGNANAVNCEDADTDPGTADEPNPDYTGPTCFATLPLYNSRAYTRTVLDGLVTPIIFGVPLVKLESEAVARCEDDEVTFSTATDYGFLDENLPTDIEQPNQRLGLIVAESAVVTFWETNWDPTTNKTTDGSDTVWVNAAHISTPTEDIIIGHAEATATCPAEPSPTATTTGPDTGPTPPPGGFPRDIDLEVSKPKLKFGSRLTFTGSVTPNAQFETPRSCVEGVPVTIRRDVFGGEEEFVDIGTVRTDSEGQFSFNYTADTSAQWVAFIPKDQPIDCAQSASEPERVLVTKRPNLRLSDTSVRKGQYVRFTLSFEPCAGHQGARIYLMKAIEGKSTKVAARKTSNECVAVIRRRVYETSSYQALAPKSDVDHLAGKSRLKAVEVRRGG